jgi:hypothetical protein
MSYYVILCCLPFGVDPSDPPERESVSRLVAFIDTHPFDCIHELSIMNSYAYNMPGTYY